MDFQVSKLTNAYLAFSASLWQGYKTIKRNRFRIDLQFPGDLHDGLVKVTWAHIIANEVNIDRWTGTSQQRQGSSPDKNELRSRWNALSQALQKKSDFRFVHDPCYAPLYCRPFCQIVAACK